MIASRHALTSTKTNLNLETSAGPYGDLCSQTETERLSRERYFNKGAQIRPHEMKIKFVVHGQHIEDLFLPRHRMEKKLRGNPA